MELVIKLTSEMLDEGTVVGVSPPVLLCHHTHGYSISISTACHGCFLSQRFKYLWAILGSVVL